ncbi:MAG: hypothetical protein Udaeo2_29760 [Candidatus Udaeobacter sp.]|nr:MAG: hypothetical protein Udaeo2_29760 [Candidatus Udaeobacter sp.]
MYLDSLRNPVLIIVQGLVATGCAHLANVKTTQPGVPRLMVEEEQLQSATEHLARAKHEQPSLSLGDDLSAAKLSLNVLERRPDDLSAQRIYNFSVARIVDNVQRAKIQPWQHKIDIDSGEFSLTSPMPIDVEHDPSRYDLVPTTSKNRRPILKLTHTLMVGATLVAIARSENRQFREQYKLPRLCTGHRYR